jgi:hypothetical protein
MVARPKMVASLRSRLQVTARMLVDLALRGWAGPWSVYSSCPVGLREADTLALPPKVASSPLVAVMRPPLVIVTRGKALGFESRRRRRTRDFPRRHVLDFPRRMTFFSRGATRASAAGVAEVQAPRPRTMACSRVCDMCSCPSKAVPTRDSAARSTPANSSSSEQPPPTPVLQPQRRGEQAARSCPPPSPERAKSEVWRLCHCSARV